MHDDVQASTRLCGFPECPKPVRVKGLCNGHYRQQADGRPLTPLRTTKPSTALCAFPDCSKAYYGNGLCRMHNRLRTRGDVAAKEVAARFRAPVKGSDRAVPCLVLTCTKNGWRRALCEKHYRQSRKGTLVPANAPLKVQFQSRGHWLTIASGPDRNTAHRVLRVYRLHYPEKAFRLIVGKAPA